MPTRTLNRALRDLRQATEISDVAAHSDGELLGAFLRRQDEAAFEALVRRHGPMVLGVCQRLLGDTNDAADVFQAVFLVFARKANSLRSPASLGAWLYGVAVRTSLKARSARRRHRAREKQMSTMPEVETMSPEVVPEEVLALLDEEVNALPEKYRVPVVLCELEGRSRREVAAALRVPEGTLSSRLATARKLLAERLRRRGVEVSAGVLAATLAAGVAPAAVPSALVTSTVKAGLLCAVGQPVAELVSARVAALCHGALRTMLLSKLRILAVLLLFTSLAGGLVAGGAGLFAGPAPLPEQPTDLPRATGPQGDPPPLAQSPDGPLPPGAVARLGTTRFRHGGPVTSVAFSPDGKLLASGSWDLTVRLWDPSTGKLVRELAPKAGWIWSVAFSPDGKFLAAGSAEHHQVLLWDTATGKEVHRLKGHDKTIFSVAFSPDGKTLASGSADGTVRLWETATGKEIDTFASTNTKTVRSVAFSPDGKILASAGDRGTVNIWDLATKKERNQVELARCFVLCIAFSKEGHLATGDQDKGVNLWDPATGRHLRRFEGHRLPVHSLAFSSDGKTLASASGHLNYTWAHSQPGEAILWDVATGKEIRRLNEQVNSLHGVAFAPDGKTVAAADEAAVVHLWETATGKARTPTGAHQGGVQSIALTPDGKTAVSAGRDGMVRVWGLEKKEEVRCFGAGITVESSAALSPDGKLTAAGGLDRRLYLWETATGKEVRRFEGHTDAVRASAFSPDGKLLASGGHDQTIRLWDVASGKEVRQLREHQAWIRCLAFSPDGRLLASGSGDNSVRLWDVATGEELRKQGHSLLVTNVVFSPDGRTLASSSRDDAIRLWEVATGKLRWEIGPFGWGTSCVAFSPDGRTLLIGKSETERGLRLYDLATGKEMCRFHGHRGFYSAAVFAPDGRRLLTASDDSSLVVWDVARLCPKGRPEPEKLAQQDLEPAWRELLDEDGTQVYRTIWRLAADGASVSLLQKHLKPVPAVDAKQLARLLADLDSDDFSVRQKAASDLERLGEAAEPGLRKALDGKPSAEVRRQVTVLLEQLVEKELKGERLRSLRALEVLELAGTTEARQLLEALAKGEPGARLTREASAALQRLERRPTGTP
jgi:RNA polymerase sigma factor (sigma-70 family)